jgi:hypothetical protein
LIEIPPSHGSQSKQANLCPVQYATGGILNLAVIFVKLLVQDFLENIWLAVAFAENDG